MNKTIILIGPIGTGKTTIGRLLAQKLNHPLRSIDQLRSAYYEKIGYDNAHAADQGIQAVIKYSKPFEAQMVEMILADNPNSIIDFGASNSVYDDQNLLQRVQNALAPYPNVILLLPSPDTAESNQILKERLIKMLTEAGKTYSDKSFELNNYFIQHPSNHHLAKTIVYTKGKSAEQICDEIVAGLATFKKASYDPSE